MQSTNTTGLSLKCIANRSQSGSREIWLMDLNGHHERRPIAWATDQQAVFVPALTVGGAALLHVGLQGEVRVVRENRGGATTTRGVPAAEYVLFDHDAKFGNAVLNCLQSSGLKPLRTSIRSPWQNGTAERWVGSARRELFDRIIPLNEYHVRRLGREYVAYYHDDRTHIGLNKATPTHRSTEQRPLGRSHIRSVPRLGGLHHRYSWSEAA